MPENGLAEIVAAALGRPAEYPPSRFAGRGIVICAGGPRYFTCAFVLLHVLRNALGCQLPVQIWHLGQHELSPAMQGLLKGQGAEIVDAEPLLERYPATIRNGWALKPFAVAHSRFDEVLSLDADALPLVNPEQVFDWPEYQRDGALFWPDVVDLAAENPVWAALGLPPRRETAWETGQFVLDKARCWAVLALTVALNSASDQLYEMIYGEKDSFLLAFHLCRQPFHLMAQPPMQFDSDLLQLDPAGAPFIHHRTFSKFLLHGPNRPVFGNQLNPSVTAALAALRRGWTGVVFHPPAMSEAAQAMAASLIGQPFTYITSGAGRRAIVLDAGFQVGAGQAEFERHWAVVERKGALLLQFYSATRLALELHPMADGSWVGATDSAIGFSAQLVPEPAAATMPASAAKLLPATADILLNPILQGAALGAGFDPELLAELRAAFSLLNRVYDDVPEALLEWLAQDKNTGPTWPVELTALAAALANVRAERQAAIAPNPAPMDVLRPGLYDRN